MLGDLQPEAGVSTETEGNVGVGSRWISSVSGSTKTDRSKFAETKLRRVRCSASSGPSLSERSIFGRGMGTEPAGCDLVSREESRSHSLQDHLSILESRAAYVKQWSRQRAELHRFTNPAEGQASQASLLLRDGHPRGAGVLPEAWPRACRRPRHHHRRRVQFSAWAADRAAGLDAIMLAPTRDLVPDLNRRASTHRLNRSPAAQEVRLADGNPASIADVIITRTNDRQLRLTATDWVKNGDRWTITHIGRHGVLTVRHNRSRLTVRLPADYVQTSTGLGYATTIHSAKASPLTPCTDSQPGRNPASSCTP
jgi:hypothetical protein